MTRRLARECHIYETPVRPKFGPNNPPHRLIGGGGGVGVGVSDSPRPSHSECRVLPQPGRQCQWQAQPQGRRLARRWPAGYYYVPI